MDRLLTWLAACPNTISAYQNSLFDNILRTVSRFAVFQLSAAYDVHTFSRHQHIIENAASAFRDLDRLSHCAPPTPSRASFDHTETDHGFAVKHRKSLSQKQRKRASSTFHSLSVEDFDWKHCNALDIAPPASLSEVPGVIEEIMCELVSLQEVR